MHRQGFSLVELSIVLVILGLLAGGVLSGQALIRAAELRSVSVQMSNYTAAIYGFRDKYFSLPGDMTNAQSFWNAAADCTTNNGGTFTTGTCNGNGDGKLNESTDTAVNWNEPFRAWQQLALAGLIEGAYSGTAIQNSVSNSQFYGSTPGTNVPKAKLSNACFSLSYQDSPGDPGTYKMNYGNTFWFGKTSGHRCQGAVLKPEEAWNIDTKLDDGKPGIGKFLARLDGTSDYNFGGQYACASGSNTDYDTSAYQLTITVASCAFMIKTGF